MDSKELEFNSLVNKYLMARFNYQKGKARLHNSTIYLDRVEVDLYLRIWFSRKLSFFGYEKIIVIARIGFQNTRKGNGSDFLRFLIQHAEHFGYNYIGVEAALTKEIKEFCSKYGFREISPHNYLIEVPTLNKKFSKTQ